MKKNHFQTHFFFDFISIAKRLKGHQVKTTEPIGLKQNLTVLPKITYRLVQSPKSEVLSFGPWRACYGWIKAGL